jgi:hypothetical protein
VEAYVPGRAEELEGDPIRVAKTQGRPVLCVPDLAVLDPELIEAAAPFLHLSLVSATERDMVQARPELVEAAVQR